MPRHFRDYERVRFVLKGKRDEFLLVDRAVECLELGCGTEVSRVLLARCSPTFLQTALRHVRVKVRVRIIVNSVHTSSHFPTKAYQVL